jgi:hypothetical protein
MDQTGPQFVPADQFIAGTLFNLPFKPDTPTTISMTIMKTNLTPHIMVINAVAILAMTAARALNLNYAARISIRLSIREHLSGV